MDVGLTNWSEVGGGWTEEVDDVKKVGEQELSDSRALTWRLAGCGVDSM